VLLLGLAGCDQPTGVVIKVSGASDASDLWLTVGTERSSSTDLLRFHQEDESGLLEIGEAVPDGFEIYLDRTELMAQNKVALVLDSVVNGTPLEMRRDSYVVKPDANALTEVKLAPKKIGPGQWICAGRPASDAAPGFVVALDDNDLDCDHDGWNYPSDLNDTDPLMSGDPTWGLGTGTRVGRCVVKLGLRELGNFEPTDCSGCIAPDDTSFETCLRDLSLIRCEVSQSFGVAAVKTLAGSVSNPTWELIRLGTDNINAYFLPSIQAPSEWSVAFTSKPLSIAKVGWFLLNDRFSRNSKLIRVEMKEGGGIPAGIARCAPRT
jgi:hypothetical protein